MGMKVAVTAAAQAAGVDGDTIRRWCDTGRLPHTRTAGNARRIDLDDLALVTQPGRPRKAAHINPIAQIATWADISDEWAGWEPEPAASTTHLEALAIDIRAVIRNLAAMADELNDELDRR